MPNSPNSPVSAQDDAGAEAPAMTVEEFLDLSTPDLVKYMRQNRQPDGTVQLGAVLGWTDLSPAGREQLRSRTLRGTEALEDEDSIAENRPVDAGQLAALLTEVEQSGITRSPLPRHPTPPTPDENAIFNALNELSPSPPFQAPDWEGIAYRVLVQEGGRPLFTIDRMDDIASNPEAHYDLLRPWAKDPAAPEPRDWMIFRRQKRDWRNFRLWQRNNRTRTWNAEEYFALYLAEWRADQIAQGRLATTERPGFEKYVRDIYDRGRTRRPRDWKSKREPVGEQGFPAYVEAARQRLKEHGFTQPFQFHEDATCQDTWTTWVEYIEFTCWRLDDERGRLARSQPAHDAKWKALVDSGVIEDGETPDSVCTHEAQRARKSALLAMPGHPSSTRPKGSPEFEAAMNRYNLLYDFELKTMYYRGRKANIRHLEALISLLMELAPQIWDEEQEKRRQTATEGDQTAMEGHQAAAGRRIKRGRHEDEHESSVEPRAKRRRGSVTSMTSPQPRLTNDQAEVPVINQQATGLEAEKAADQFQPVTDSQGERPTTSAVREVTVDAQPPGKPRARAARPVGGRTRAEWMTCLRKRPGGTRAETVEAKPEQPRRRRSPRKKR